MALIVIPHRFAQRIDIAANWTTNNPVLYDGEIGYEVVPEAPPKQKVGDGVTTWNALPYFTTGSGSSDTRDTRDFWLMG